MSVPLPPTLPEMNSPSIGRRRSPFLAAVALALLLTPAAVAAWGCGSPTAARGVTLSLTPVDTTGAPAEPQLPAAASPAPLDPQTPESLTFEVDGGETQPATPTIGETQLAAPTVGDPDASARPTDQVLGGQQERPADEPPAPETRSPGIALEKTGDPTLAPAAVLPSPSEPVYPLAVMVENLADARPQSGLARADIVYEALVEGNITRFMAVYLNGRSDTIGPVRSARHYFVYLAAEFNASYIHIGSSPQGYAALKATRVTNLDETYGDPGFWRSRARYAPHNAYTSTDLILSSLERVRHVTPGSLAGFRFLQEAETPQGAEAGEVSLIYPGAYGVKYVYSPEDKQYRRYMEGLPHKDADTGEQVSPTNVVVQFVKAWLIPGDDAGRLDMEQVGEGKALYFRSGVVTEGYWHKPSYGDYTEWYDADWKPVMMNPGRTWVQMIPPSGKVSY